MTINIQVNWDLVRRQKVAQKKLLKELQPHPASFMIWNDDALRNHKASLMRGGVSGEEVQAFMPVVNVTIEKRIERLCILLAESYPLQNTFSEDRFPGFVSGWNGSAEDFYMMRFYTHEVQSLRIRSLPLIARYYDLKLNSPEIKTLGEYRRRSNWSITPFVMIMGDPTNPSGCLSTRHMVPFRQIAPDVITEEHNYDPSLETEFDVGGGYLWQFPLQGLKIVTLTVECANLCPECQREMLMTPDRKLKNSKQREHKHSAQQFTIHALEDIDVAVTFVQEHMGHLFQLILSGGDYMSVNTMLRLVLLKRLLQVLPDTAIVRLASFVPVTISSEFNEEFLQGLTAIVDEFGPRIKVMTNLTVPHELTPKLRKVTLGLLRAGVSTQYQTKALLGVNIFNNVAFQGAMASLQLYAPSCGAWPYKGFLAKETPNSMDPYSTGIRLVDEMQSQFLGLIPGEMLLQWYIARTEIGKIPLTPSFRSGIVSDPERGLLVAFSHPDKAKYAPETTYYYPLEPSKKAAYM